MKFTYRLSAFLVMASLATGFTILGTCRSARAVEPASPAAATASGDSPTSPAASQTTETIIIPGPLRSFLRMAGISQESKPADLLPLLARNAFLYGHQMGKKTEYLVLEDRYVHQARELQPLAVSNGQIQVTGCSDVQPLIQVLGYQFENGCSHDGATLITANAERAFLTLDSGFPLTKLEQSLQQGAPFTYAYPATRVPILFHEDDWLSLLPAKDRAARSLAERPGCGSPLRRDVEARS
jgi:hypothetical protein